MKATENEPSLLSEVKRLQAEVRRLQRERDQARSTLADLERYGQNTWFWDGSPQGLADVAAQIRQLFGYRILSFSFFEGGILRRRVVDPPDAESGVGLSSQDIDRAFEEKQPTIFAHADGDVLVVPLTASLHRVGVIEIGLPGPATSREIDLWHTLSPQFTSIVIGGQLVAQHDEVRRRQQLLYSVTRRLVPGLDLDEMMSRVLDLTVPYSGADRGSIMLLNDQSQVIHHVLSRKELSEKEQERAIQTVLDRGLAGWMVKNRKATIIADTLTDRRWGHLPDDTTNVRSVLAAPLQRGDRIRGLLFLVHHEPNFFDGDHLLLLSSAVDQAAIAVENAYLLGQTEQRVNELALLNEISQAASSLHLNDVLHIVTHRVVQALQVRRCAVFLLDDTGARLALRAVNGPDLVGDEIGTAVLRQDRLHIDQAIETRRPVEIRDIFADERLRFFWDKARELNIATQLAVPLIAQQRVIGVLSIDRSAAHPSFAESEIELCQTIAHQAANAIENARLYEEVERRAERLWLANMVSHEIGASTDIDTLLWKVVRLIRETLDYYCVAIALIEKGELVFRAGVNYLDQPAACVRLPPKGDAEGIADWVAREGHPLLVPDVLEDERYQPEVELPNTRSELAVPLKVPARGPGGTAGASRTIGVLDVKSAQSNAFSADDQDLLETLAAEVAVAIESARLEGRMREERATLDAIINGTSDAIIVTDSDDRILFFNPAARDAFLNGESWMPGSLVSQVVRNPALADFWDVVPREMARSAEIPLPDGRTLYATMTLIAGVGKAAMMQDITHLKEIDKVKSEFVSTVSHDLRSPLQIIQTSAELLPRLGTLSQEQQEQIDHILGVVRRVSELVQNLLDIGRIEAGIGMEVEPCAIDEIIADTAGTLRTLAQSKGIDLVLDLPGMLPFVHGNSFRLDQVISNLVNNAIKFTPEGSVTVRARAGKDEVVVEVIDTGIGIPLGEQGQVFQRFYRVRSPQVQGAQGTGLGLTIVKSIVESYGGRVEVVSFPRLGSTFRVVLPIYANEEKQTHARDSAGAL